MIWSDKMSIFRKIFELEMETDRTEYPLNEWQVMNGKPISKFIVPNLNFTFYAAANYGGTGTYTTNPASPGNKPLARVEAINGAYMSLTNADNQIMEDQIPLMLYRQDPEYFGEKGLFKDKPCIDFTQSKIWYPSNVIPNAENGRSILIIVEYWDITGPNTK